MANYPTSLDTLTNPVSGQHLNTPDHVVQHSNVNDIAEQLELKLGTGSSTPTNVNDVLTVTGSGASAWSAPSGGGLNSASLVYAALTFR